MTLSSVPAAAGRPQPRTYIVVHARAYYLTPGDTNLMAAPLDANGAPSFTAARAINYTALSMREEVAVRELARSLGWLASAGIETALAP